jgi:hypothetical protein
MFTPSHFLKLPGVCDDSQASSSLQPCNAFALTLGLPFSWLATLQPLALVTSPKLGLRHLQDTSVKQRQPLKLAKEDPTTLTPIWHQFPKCEIFYSKKSYILLEIKLNFKNKFKNSN